jgi:hypothetical protein
LAKKFPGFSMLRIKQHDLLEMNLCPLQLSIFYICQSPVELVIHQVAAFGAVFFKLFFGAPIVIAGNKFKKLPEVVVKF